VQKVFSLADPGEPLLSPDISPGLAEGRSVQPGWNSREVTTDEGRAECHPSYGLCRASEDQLAALQPDPPHFTRWHPPSPNYSHYHY